MQVFAYGQTGAGKTYVMGTAATKAQLGSPREEHGVVPRGVNYLFSKMPELRRDHLVTLRVRSCTADATAAEQPCAVLELAPMRALPSAMQRQPSTPTLPPHPAGCRWSMWRSTRTMCGTCCALLTRHAWGPLSSERTP